jgi:M6 family metalloprotease-like protein
MIPLLTMSAAYSSSSLSPLSATLTKAKPLSITPWKPRPVLGPQSTLILLVQFQDVRLRSSIDEIRSLVDLVDKWFRRSSYGKTYIDYTIHEDPLTLPNTMSAYGVPKAGNERGDDPAREEAYVVDVLNAIISQESVDLTKYKHVVMIHAGGDEADTGNPNELWSHCDCVGPIADENPSREASWVLYDESGRITHAFWGISTFSEHEPWAVFVHEFTHSLGVSDLYVYDSDGYSAGPGVGFWSNMAAGAFLDPPADIDGWNKYILGWIEATSVDSPSGEFTIHTLDSVEEPKALLIAINGNEDEYYFLHARRKVDMDSALPSEGVIVFKINRWRERSLEGEELALLSDANPATPSDCDSYRGEGRELCRPLDAPYNEKGKQYQFSFYGFSENLVLNDDGFWDESAGIAFKVQPAGDEAFKITLGGSPEEVGIEVTTPTTSTTEPETPSCIIATSAFGSTMAPEVTYMRLVRDKMIGSTRVGRELINGFNAFYYSWSPSLAQAVAPNSVLRAIFRALLLPLVWTVHVAEASFTVVSDLTGSADLASMTAFLVAACISLTWCAAVPILAGTKIAAIVKARRTDLRNERERASARLG